MGGAAGDGARVGGFTGAGEASRLGARPDQWRRRGVVADGEVRRAAGGKPQTALAGHAAVGARAQVMRAWVCR